jgi:hypothetical protein
MIICPLHIHRRIERIQPLNRQAEPDRIIRPPRHRRPNPLQGGGGNGGGKGRTTGDVYHSSCPDLEQNPFGPLRPNGRFAFLINNLEQYLIHFDRILL